MTLEQAIELAREAAAKEYGHRCYHDAEDPLQLREHEALMAEQIKQMDLAELEVRFSFVPEKIAEVKTSKKDK